MRKLVALTALILAFLLPLAGCMTPAKTSLEEFSPPFAVPSANQSSADVSAEVSLSHNASPSVNPIEPPESPEPDIQEIMWSFIWRSNWMGTEIDGVKDIGTLMCDARDDAITKWFFPYHENWDDPPLDIYIRFLLPKSEFPMEKVGDYTYVLLCKDFSYNYRLFKMNTPVLVGNVGEYGFLGFLDYAEDFMCDDVWYDIVLFVIDENSSEGKQLCLWDENSQFVAEGRWVCWSSGGFEYDAKQRAYVESLKQQIAEGQSNQ